MHASVRDRRRCGLSRPRLCAERPSSTDVVARGTRVTDLTARALLRRSARAKTIHLAAGLYRRRRVLLRRRSPGIGVAAAAIYRTGPLVHSGAGTASC